MEILMVIAMIGLMLGVSGPLVSGIRQSGDFNKAILDLSLILEQAQMHAMANNTYVWVGFRQDTTKKIVFAAMAESLTREPQPGTDKTAYKLLGKVHSFENLEIANSLTIPTALAPNDNVLASAISAFEDRSGPYTKVIQFMPSGEVRIGADASRRIQIGLRPMRGSMPDQNNIAVIQIAGLTGKVRIFRP